jgi:Subtilase family
MVKRVFAGCIVVLVISLGGATGASAAAVKPATKVTEDLAALHAEHAAALAAGVPFRTTNALLPVNGDWVTIDATASSDASALRAELMALGAQGVVVFGRVVSARLPIPAIPALDGMASLQFARPAYRTLHAGLVTSQGDQAMRADLARTALGVNGAGVTVGALSDSFDCQGGAAGDVASGDLSPVNVLQEDPGCGSGTDEGRAMLQIVHDVAPGAGLAFATADGGQANFANNIVNLAAAGARVIVDDVGYFAEPMFQDGIIAQAVDTVAAQGVVYFSSAGNAARQAYDHAFVPGTVYAAGALGTPAFLGGTAHNFNPGGTEDNFQKFSLPGGRSFALSLQWDSPFFSVSGVGTTTDLDIYVLNDPPTTVLFGVTTNNITSGDPVEVMFVSCPGPGTCVGSLMIVNHSGPNPGRIKYIVQQAPTINILEYGTSSGTIYGHANAASAIAVGATDYRQTPAFGVSPAVLEFYSSGGTTPILFTTGGAPTVDARASKPEIVAPDGGDTTFFGVDVDGNGRPNFFGTSAAAPHAAGVAALMRGAIPSLTRAQIRTTLENTALDMGPAGFDTDSGFGLIQADAALSSLHSLTITAGPSGSPNPAASAGTVALGVTASDSFVGHAPSYLWTASCAGLPSNGSFNDSSLQNPTWTAPANTTGSAVICTMSVTASDGHGLTASASYPQTVSSAFTLTVVKAGSGSGTVTSAPAGIDCGTTCAADFLAGSMITLTGTPTPGSVLRELTGGGCSGAEPCPVSLTGQTTVTATFAGDLVNVAVNRGQFTAGTTVHVAVSVNNLEQPAIATFFVGALLPDGDTLVFMTGSGIAFGRLSDPTTYRPIAAGVSLVAPLVLTVPDFLVYTWTGGEPHGSYVFFLAALDAATGSILGLSTATGVLGP